MGDAVYQQQLRDAYEEPRKWSPSNEQLFRWTADPLVCGRNVAIRLARREGRTDWKEVDTIARREIMSAFPTKVDLLVSQVRSPMKDEDVEWDIEKLASGLGVLRECEMCGSNIVDPDELADAVVSHYGVRGAKVDRIHESIAISVSASAVDTGGWNNPVLWSYCDNTMSKDD